MKIDSGLSFQRLLRRKWENIDLQYFEYYPMKSCRYTQVNHKNSIHQFVYIEPCEQQTHKPNSQGGAARDETRNVLTEHMRQEREGTPSRECGYIDSLHYQCWSTLV